MTQDTIRIFKGDSAPVESLANKWNCSKEEVWKKCKNPYKIQRVLHECEDGKTIQLVPRLYHNNIVHTGGIEMIVNKILCTES